MFRAIIRIYILVQILKLEHIYDQNDDVAVTKNAHFSFLWSKSVRFDIIFISAITELV